MFGSAILDVAIGMIFVYLLVALVVTSLSELIAAWLKWRPKNLAAGIQKLLSGGATGGLAKSLYDHALIKSLFKGGVGPSYIPSRTFAIALLDIVSPAEISGPRTLAKVQNGINEVKDPGVKRALTVLLEEADHDIKNFEEAIEIWFNNSMERVSGWYKRKSQVINVVLAALITILANADSIQIAKSLSSDPALRATIVAEAQKFAEQNTAQSFSPQAPPSDSEAAKETAEAAQAKLNKYKNEIQKLGVPLGWARAKGDPRSYHLSALGWIRKLLGLLLTAIAASLGAPFWFDMLNKVINIRSAGKAPEEEQKSPKKRQTPPEPGETPRQASEREEHGDSQ